MFGLLFDVADIYAFAGDFPSYWFIIYVQINHKEK